MRIGNLIMATVGALAIAGCSHSNTQARDDSRTAWDSTKDAFGTAYGAVKTGARSVAHAGGWVLEKAGDGVVRVMYMAHTGKAARVTDDAWITTKLKGEYGMDRDVTASHVIVHTKNGVVTLRGTVDSPFEAERAIQRALDTPGVAAVNSELAWPERRNAHYYVPGEDVHLRSGRR
jgi:osmotically-inducible protein OsmY